MPSPTYSQSYNVDQIVQCFWAVEATTAGTAPILSSTSWNTEGIISFNPNPQRVRYNGREWVGLPVSTLTSIELRHHSMFSISVPCRFGAPGLAGMVAATIAGDVTNTGTVDTITGAADPYTHTIVPGKNGTREVTYSIAISQTGDGNNVHLYTYATPISFKLAFDSSNILVAQIDFVSRWHSVTTKPTSPTTVTPNTRTISTQGTFHIKSNAGTDYTAKPLSGDFTIMQEGPEVIFTVANNTKDPLEIVPGALSLSASFDFLYDSSQSGTPYGDFLADVTVGPTSGQANSMGWTDADGHGATWTFWPAKWESLTIVRGSGQAAHLNGQLTAFQDEGTLGSLTLWKNLVMLTKTNTVFVI